MTTISVFAPDDAAPQDLRLTPRGDLELADGLEDIRQRVIERLRFWRGEWYLDLTDGVPYLQDVFTRPITADLSARIITEQIRSVRGVTGVRDVVAELQTVDRRLIYSAIVDTVYGTTQVTS